MDLRKVLKMGPDKTSDISVSILHVRWHVKCLLCKTEMFCYNIDEVYTVLTTGNFTQRNKGCHKGTIGCSHKAPKLPVWEHLVIWEQAVPCLHPCSASHLMLCPDRSSGHCSRLASGHFQHLCRFCSVLHSSRTGSTVSFMPSYVK